MGRIYGLSGEPGERSGKGIRMFSSTGTRILKAFRIEFQDDAEEGVASVHLYVCDAAGNPLFDPVANAAATAVVKIWVRVVGPGQPDPPLTPHAVLYRKGNDVIWHPNDPIPDEAFTAMGGVVEREVK